MVNKFVRGSRYGLGIALGVALGVLGLGNSSAEASLPSLYYSTAGYPESYFANISDMIDLDQSRSPLPIIGLRGLRLDGNAHCGPAAGADVLGFLAEHGFPRAAEGKTPWTWFDGTVSGMNEATAFIEGLAYEMGTRVGTEGDGRSSDGTPPAQFLAGISSRLADAGGTSREMRFEVENRNAHGCVPEHGNVNAKTVFRNIAAGNLVTAHLTYFVPYPHKAGYWRASTAHFVVVTGAVRTGGKEFLIVVNPASTDSATSQDEKRVHTFEMGAEEMNIVSGSLACETSVQELKAIDGVAPMEASGYRKVLTNLTVIKVPRGRPYTGATPLDLSTLRE
jgi:hypothetical protein